MVSFTRPIVDRGISDKPVLYLINSDREQLFAMYYRYRTTVKKWDVEIPEDSVTNFLSVPRFFRPLVRFFISPVDRHLSVPAIIHDYLVKEWPTDVTVYSHEEKRWKYGSAIDLTWKQAAEIFPDYCDKHFPSSKTAWIKSRTARLLICAFGLVMRKLNKPIKG